MKQASDDKICLYLKFFSKLRRDYKFGGAPHKPILLLAIINLIKKRVIINNNIEISPELVLEFKEIWTKLVDTPHTANFALPFYHLKSEPSWKLTTKNGIEIPTTSSNSIKSLNALQDSLLYAEIDNDFFEIICSEDSIIFINALLNQYFPNTRNNYINVNSNILFSKFQNEILNEDSEHYIIRIKELSEKLSNEEYQEEIFIRGGIFKREIPKIYGFQCAISGMKIETNRNIQMIDACHIVPFALSKNDTITNGIALSPNLHRAFDRGLITINDKYQVNVTKHIVDNNSPFSLIQFEGKQLSLPEKTKHYPALDCIQWHLKERFLK
jgi:putative restriction endonuclease